MEAAAGERLDIIVSDRVRWAQIWLPRTPKGAPLVLDLHGSGFDPDRHVRATTTPKWASHGAVVIAPCATLPLTFDRRVAAGWAWSVHGAPLYGNADVDPDPAGVDDVGFLDALVAFAHRTWRVDVNRTYALGYSGGARMLSQWVGRSRHAIRAACCVSGVRAPAARTTTRLLAIHGDADRINPLGGSSHLRWRESVMDACQAWSAALGCTAPADNYADEHRWTSPSGSTAVRLLTLRGSGHAWPGTDDLEQRLLFGPSNRLDATELAAAFFGLTDGALLPAPPLSQGER